jgi:hypothetical protein
VFLQCSAEGEMHSGEGGAGYMSDCNALINTWSVQIGAYGEGCPACYSPVEGTSWGVIKSMYGRRAVDR